MMNYRKAACLLVTLIFLGFIFSGVVFGVGDKLTGYGVDLSQTSVSGLSSGGFMTAQFHVAYSSILVGAGIIAGGPYYCAGASSYNSYLENATTTCMNPIGPGPDSGKLVAKAKEFAKKEWIDDLDNLRDDKVYIFSGSSDETVTTKVVDQTKEFYERVKVPGENIEYSRNIAAGHALITDNDGDVPCRETKSPFINDCDFFQPYDILNHIYDKLEAPATSLSGKFIKFDQSEFVDIRSASMSKYGYIYVPESCMTGGCKVHISIHGCRQGAEVIGDKWYSNTGYNKMADANKMIILYPQAKPSDPIPYNPKGCWDFWGYSSPDPDDPNFYKKEAPQMSAFVKMLKRLAEDPE